MSKPKTTEPKYALQVVKGGFVPADDETLAALKRTPLKIGSLVLADLQIPRNPMFYRRAHKFAQVCRDNIEAFHGLTEHSILKRLQLETGFACEPVTVPAELFWGEISGLIRAAVGAEADCALEQIGALLKDERVTAFKPASLAFGNMDESEFKAMFEGFCNYIAEKYWPDLTAAEIDALSAFMPEHT
ncbi:hypothetical protein [Marinobacter sp. MBR-105]